MDVLYKKDKDPLQKNDSLIGIQIIDNLTIIELNERVDSSNIKDIKKEISLNENKLKNKHVIINAENLKYISDSGLRLILNLFKITGKLEIINTSKEVYEIFDSTNFTKIISISKVLKNIQLEGLKKLDIGFFSTIYQIDNERCVKVFNHNISFENILKEIEITKNSFYYGLPTIIPNEMVKCGEQFGFTMEYLGEKNLSVILQNDPEKIDEYSEKMANLIKVVHSTKANKKLFPSIKEKWSKSLQKLYKIMEKEPVKKLLDIIEKVPDCETLIHGDFHCKNVMVKDRELFLIDMDEVCFGIPIIDIARFYLVYILYPKEFPKNEILMFVGTEPEICTKIWKKFSEFYFEKKNFENLQKVIDGIAHICLISHELKGFNFEIMQEEQKKRYIERIKGKTKIVLNEYYDALNSYFSQY